MPVTPPGERFALVTGTSSGIGAEVATQLVARGWTVIGIARRRAAIADARYSHIVLDLYDLDSVQHVMEREVGPVLRSSRWGRVGLVNNAASAGLLGPVPSVEPNALLEMYALNVAAPFWLMGFFSRLTSPTTPLRIVNVSSGAATVGLPGLAAYGSSKAALRMVGEVVAAEWQSTAALAPTRRDGAILSFEPNIVDTPMQETTRAYSPEEFPWVDMFHAFERQGKLLPPALPAADIVRFLESDRQPAFANRRFEVRA